MSGGLAGNTAQESRGRPSPQRVGEGARRTRSQLLRDKGPPPRPPTQLRQRTLPRIVAVSVTVGGGGIYPPKAAQCTWLVISSSEQLHIWKGWCLAGGLPFGLQMTNGPVWLHAVPACNPGASPWLGRSSGQERCLRQLDLQEDTGGECGRDASLQLPTTPHPLSPNQFS